MANLNRYWLLKYSELREQLRKCSQEPFIKACFCSCPIFEVSYPFSFKGSQLRYFNPDFTPLVSPFSDFPDGCIFKKLTKVEKSKLFLYYQLDKSLTYEKDI